MDVNIKRRQVHLYSFALFRRWQIFCFNWKVQYSRHNSLTLHSESRPGIDISTAWDVLRLAVLGYSVNARRDLIDNSIKIACRHLRHSIRSIKLLY